MPEDWHKTNTMKHAGNDLWTIAALNDRKRKRGTDDSMTAPEEAEEGEEEATISHDAAMHQAAVAAMMPKTQEDTSSPSPETRL